MHGKTAYDLPPRSLGIVSKPILTAMTGPNGGLKTVNQRQRHLSISDPDVHFIDIIDDDSQSGKSINLVILMTRPKCGRCGALFLVKIQ